MARRRWWGRWSPIWPQTSGGHAIGFTGVFAYASTLISGWGLGALVQHYGWEAGLAGLTGMAAIG